MCAVSRMLKAKEPDIVTVFVGPCVAKKDERRDTSIEGNADYVLTVGEFRAMLRAKGVKIEPEANANQQASVYGKRFGNGGGVTAAVIECMKELGKTHLSLLLKNVLVEQSVRKHLHFLKWEGFRQTLLKVWHVRAVVSEVLVIIIQTRMKHLLQRTEISS